MSKTFIFGDIHGCFREFRKLYKTIEPEREDRLIFVGDYFDRGPNSAEVYLLLRKLEKAHDCVFIRGNHDQMMLDYYRKGDGVWNLNGNAPTIESFGEFPEDLEECLQWLDEKTVLYYEAPSFNVCHAGTRTEPISDNDPMTLLWDRDSTKNADYDGKLTIVGHTPVYNKPTYCLNGEVRMLPYYVSSELPEKGLINIDTGCVYGSPFREDGDRALTVMVIEENEKGKIMSFQPCFKQYGVNLD